MRHSWGGLILLSLALIVFALPAQAEPQCNPVRVLGGRTAILRKADIDTPEKLKEILRDEKYQEAFRAIFKEAGLLEHYDALMDALGKLTPKDLREFPRGTEFDWMALRRASDHRIRVAKNACWLRDEPFQAWTFTLTIGTVVRAFALPTACLNLALLKELPPTCVIDASVSCKDRTARVTVTATPDSGAQITKIDLTASDPGVVGPRTFSVENQSTFKKEFPLGPPGPYEFSATAAADNVPTPSPECRASVTLCVEEPPKPQYIPCAAPKCTVKVAGSWPKGAAEGTLEVEASGDPAASLALCIRRGEGNCDPATLAQGKYVGAISSAGTYLAEINATTVKTEHCPAQTSTCTAGVAIEAPKPCCESRWLLRGLLGFASSQGSEETGHLHTTDRQLGTFKLGFNDGLAGVVEAEALFGSNLEPEASGWGWALGLTASTIDSVWVLDTSTRWVRDDDRVRMLALTTGPTYRWGRKPLSLHVSPLVGVANFSEATYADGSARPGTLRADFDDTFVFGLGAGLDAWLGECWGLTVGVQYLKAKARADDLGVEVDVDPLVVGLGVVYRF